MLTVIPALLLGAKLVLDRSTENEIKLKNGEEINTERLSKEVALTIAQNWNPGLTLGQQIDALYKVADGKYDKEVNTDVLNQAIPKMDIVKLKKSNKQKNVFMPIDMEVKDIKLRKMVDYEPKSKYMNRYSFTNSNWNPNYVMWRTIDVNTNPENRQSKFDEQNQEYGLDHQGIFGNPVVNYGSKQFLITTPNFADDYSTYSGLKSYSGTASKIANDSKVETYQSREQSNYMEVSIVSGDKIKVKMGNAEATAQPAQCNVDIVLAVPVNGAASNKDNLDAASVTAGSPTTGESVDTPVRQMGRSCKEFVKNFYHMRGVTMGLIPYSGKVSVSPDKSSYTRKIESFSESYFLSNPLSMKKIIGAALYGTNGNTSNRLSTAYSWGNQQTGSPIMCRRGDVWTPKDYGQNKIAKGNILSNENPNTDALKFQQMNLNPCYLGYASILSMKCDKNCTSYLPNPYYMIEPTADMVKIYEMCNALYPIEDPYNVSNFIFIPVTWTNNFWKSWTTNPGVSITTGSGNNARLSIPSKEASGRKKALILLVNKPDYFEPGELTYVGFDNDYSDIPTYESDRINFSINYSDTTKKLFYNNSYNGTIAGPKKILKYTGGTLSKGTYYYASGTVTGRLSFPHKGVVMIRVDRYSSSSTATFKFTNANNSTSYTITRPRTFCVTPSNISDTKDSDGNYYVEFTMTNIKLIFAEISNRNYSSITPSCSLSGTTRATGSTQQTAYVNTNVLEPIYVKVRPTSASGTVKFSNISSYTMDGTSYSSGTTHTLTAAKTFTFPGGSLSSSGYSSSSNFGSNYGINKIGYTLDNATITNANISAGSQVLRYSSSGKDSGLAIYNANTGTSELSSYTSSYYKYWTIVMMGLNNVYTKWTTNYKQDSYSYDCSYQDSYSCTKYENYSCTKTESYSCTKNEYYDCNCSSYSCNCYTDTYSCNCKTSYYDCNCSTQSVCTSHEYGITYKNFEFTSSGWKYQHSANKTTTHNRSSEIYPVTPDNYCQTFTPSAYNCSCGSISVSPCYRCSGCNTNSSNLSSKVLGVTYNGCKSSSNKTVCDRCSKETCSTCSRKLCDTCRSCDTCSRSYTGTCTRSYTGTCTRSYTGTCYKTVSQTCTGYKGSAGTMYYSALNTANVRSGTDIYSNSCPWRSTSAPSKYSSQSASSSYGTYSGAGGKSAVFYIVNNTGAVGQQLTQFYAKNNGQAITWGGMNQSDSWVNNNQGISANSSYIRFNGDSTITVEITPNVIDGYIYYKTPNQGRTSRTVSGASASTITIDPTTHYYEKTSSGYRVALTLQEAELDTSYGAQFVTTPSTDYRYNAIEKSGINTRYIDYANSSNPSYDSSQLYTSYSTYYNGLNQAIAANSSYNNVSYISPRTLWGDIIHVMEENSPAGDRPPYVNAIIGENGSANYYVAGTTRIFAPISRNSTYKYLTLMEKSGSDSTTSGGALDLLITNITYPANYILYQGGYQSSTSITPTAAAAEITKAACSKLKSDYGNNLRIYVLKYRKQTQYKSFPMYGISQTNQNHDYSAVDGCATSSNYLYDISNETDLKNKLNEIANNIKSWSGYEAAK